jgi:hypothetical protein
VPEGDHRTRPRKEIESMTELTPESASPGSPQPAPWEEHAAFRSTFLMHFTQAGDRAALEAVGQLLYDMLLEVSGRWPEWPESPTRVEMRAVVADLRHAQSFLATIAQARHASSLEVEDEQLSLLADECSVMVGRTANGIESFLGAPATGGVQP